MRWKVPGFQNTYHIGKVLKKQQNVAWRHVEGKKEQNEVCLILKGLGASRQARIPVNKKEIERNYL